MTPNKELKQKIKTKIQNLHKWDYIYLTKSEILEDKLKQTMAIIKDMAEYIGIND